jgi:hypothetical protein
MAEVSAREQHQAKLELLHVDTRLHNAVVGLRYKTGESRQAAMKACIGVAAIIAEELDLSPIHIPEAIKATEAAELEAYNDLIRAGYA